MTVTTVHNQRTKTGDAISLAPMTRRFHFSTRTALFGRPARIPISRAVPSRFLLIATASTTLPVRAIRDQFESPKNHSPPQRRPSCAAPTRCTSGDAAEIGGDFGSTGAQRGRFVTDTLFLAAFERRKSVQKLPRRGKNAYRRCAGVRCRGFCAEECWFGRFLADDALVPALAKSLVKFRSVTTRK